MEKSANPVKEFVDRGLERIYTEQKGTLNDRMKPEYYGGSVEDKVVELKYPILDWEINGIGTLHGGIISAMTDFTMSFGLECFHQGVIPPTISQTVNFLRPVPRCEYVIVRARATSVGRKVGTSYCEIIIPDTGKVAATAVGTYSFPQIDK